MTGRHASSMPRVQKANAAPWHSADAFSGALVRIRWVSPRARAKIRSSVHCMDRTGENMFQAHATTSGLRPGKTIAPVSLLAVLLACGNSGGKDGGTGTTGGGWPAAGVPAQEVRHHRAVEAPGELKPPAAWQPRAGLRLVVGFTVRAAGRQAAALPRPAGSRHRR